MIISGHLSMTSKPMGTFVAISKNMTHHPLYINLEGIKKIHNGICQKLKRRFLIQNMYNPFNIYLYKELGYTQMNESLNTIILHGYKFIGLASFPLEETYSK